MFSYIHVYTLAYLFAVFHKELESFIYKYLKKSHFLSVVYQETFSDFEWEVNRVQKNGTSTALHIILWHSVFRNITECQFQIFLFHTNQFRGFYPESHLLFYKASTISLSEFRVKKLSEMSGIDLYNGWTEKSL